MTGVRPSIDLGLAGALDLRVLSAFVSGLESGGSARANLRITGPLDKPEVVGEIGVADAELQMDSPRARGDGSSRHSRVGDGRKATVSLTGLRQHRACQARGHTRPCGHRRTSRPTAVHRARHRVRVPAGLQTESDADLAVALGANPTLSGRIEVQGGTDREPLVLSSQLLNLSSASGIAVSAPSSDWLSRVAARRRRRRLSTDLRIDNNYGRLDVGLAALRLVGTAGRARACSARLQAAEDGEIYLGGNTYRIERLTIDSEQSSCGHARGEFLGSDEDWQLCRLASSCGVRRPARASAR